VSGYTAGQIERRLGSETQDETVAKLTARVEATERTLYAIGGLLSQHVSSAGPEVDAIYRIWLGDLDKLETSKKPTAG